MPDRFVVPYCSSMTIHFSPISASVCFSFIVTSEDDKIKCHSLYCKKSGAIIPNVIIAPDFTYGLLRPVKEGYNLPSRAVLINAEGTFLRTGGIAGRDLILSSPENRFIEDMGLGDIREWGL